MKKNVISDELLARFIENRTSEEETEQVIRYLSSEDSGLDEFLAMRQGSMFNSDYCADKNVQMAASKNIHETLHKSKNNRMQFRKKWIIGLASVAAVFAAVVFILQIPSQKDREKLANNSASEKITVKIKEDGDKAAPIMNENSTQEVSPSQSSETEMPVKPQIKEQNRASMAVINHFEMISPNKISEHLLCKNLKDFYTFSWKAENAVTVHFLLKDNEGTVLADKQGEYFDNYSIPFSNLQSETSLTWQLVIAFEDGSQSSQSGALEIDYKLK